MKKFFAFVAAALVAFGFTACEGAGGGSNFFKITVSNIGSTTADLSIVPADTTVYYGVGLFYTADVVKSTADSIAAEYIAEIAAIIEQGYGLDVMAQYGIVLKGKLESPLENLPANSELTVLAYRVVEQGGTVVLGDVTTKNFKTKDVVVTEEVDLGTLANGYFEDYRGEDGSYMAYGWDDEQTIEIGLNIVDDDFVGKFTENELMLEYSYIWTKDMNSENGLAILKAQLEGKLAGQDKASVAGWVIAANGIKYKFSFTYPTVEEAASAPKKAAKKANKELELQPRTLKVVRK